MWGIILSLRMPIPKDLDRLKISVYGLGYVGCVLAVCLKKMGHDVTGVDVIVDKVEAINSGKLPFYEPDLDETNAASSTGSLIATTDGSEAVNGSVISFVCVGTPSTASAGVDLNQIISTVKEIGSSIKAKGEKHLIVIRSTIPPGTIDEVIIPLLNENIGLKEGIDYEVCFYPEFLREGNAVADLLKPSLNVLGAQKNFPVEVMEEIFEQIDIPFELTDFKSAEMLKYACNAFHGLKVTFANEIGALSKEFEIDGAGVIELLTKDTLLNISTYYLTPGFAYGGSCIPKELRAIENIAREKGLELDLLSAIGESNNRHINRLVSLLESLNVKRAGFVGITFKPNTDDIRESPVLEAVSKLLHAKTGYKKGITPILFDNKQVLEKVKSDFPSGMEFADNLDDLLESSDSIILGPLKLTQSEYELLNSSGKIIIDLKWHKVPEGLKNNSSYETIV